MHRITRHHLGAGNRWGSNFSFFSLFRGGCGYMNSFFKNGQAMLQFFMPFIQSNEAAQRSGLNHFMKNRYLSNSACKEAMELCRHRFRTSSEWIRAPFSCKRWQPSPRAPPKGFAQLLIPCPLRSGAGDRSARARLCLRPLTNGSPGEGLEASTRANWHNFSSICTGSSIPMANFRCATRELLELRRKPASATLSC